MRHPDLNLLSAARRSHAKGLLLQFLCSGVYAWTRVGFKGQVQ